MPRIPPSRLYKTSPDFGSKRTIRCAYVSDETYLVLERSSPPTRKLVVRRQTSPFCVHFGVAWRQSTIWVHNCSGDAQIQPCGSSGSALDAINLGFRNFLSLV